MNSSAATAIFWICAFALTGFYMWLEHDKEMNGPCRDCSECVERWQDNLKVEKE